MQTKLTGLLIPFFTISIIAIIAFVWTIPNVREYQTVITDADLAQRELDQSLIPEREILAAIDANEVQGVLDELNVVLPESLDPGLILGILEELSVRHNLQLTSQTFVRKDVQEQMLEFGFTVLGAPSDTNNFLKELENVKPVIYVKLLSAASSTDDDGVKLTKTSMNIISPYGTSDIEVDENLSQTVNENDKEVLARLKERFNYFATALHYKISDPISRGKNDPFNETNTE